MLACEAVTYGAAGWGSAATGLADVTLHAEPGEILAVVGVPRGGPGTLLRVLAGRVAPRHGTVRIAGRPVHEAVALGTVGYVRAGAVGPEVLTAVEWLRHVAALRGGRTLESVLAVCRMERLPVQGSAIRYHTLDDLLVSGAPPDPVRVSALG